MEIKIAGISIKMSAFPDTDYGKMVKDMLNRNYDAQVNQLLSKVYADGKDVMKVVGELKQSSAKGDLYKAITNNELMTNVPRSKLRADKLTQEAFNEAVKEAFFKAGGQTHELASVQGGRRQQRSSRRNSRNSQRNSRNSQRNSRNSQRNSRNSQSNSQRNSRNSQRNSQRNSRNSQRNSQQSRR